MPGSLPNPGAPPGTPDQSMPFDHVVVVMMENHSLDNLLGALPLAGRGDVTALVTYGVAPGLADRLAVDLGVQHLPAPDRPRPLPN